MNQVLGLLPPTGMTCMELLAPVFNLTQLRMLESEFGEQSRWEMILSLFVSTFQKGKKYWDTRQWITLSKILYMYGAAISLLIIKKKCLFNSYFYISRFFSSSLGKIFCVKTLDILSQGVCSLIAPSLTPVNPAIYFSLLFMTPTFHFSHYEGKL